MDKLTSTGQLMFYLFVEFAEFEQSLILERSAAERVVAGARGRFGGRQEKLTEQDFELLKTLMDSSRPIKPIAERWNVIKTTICRYLTKDLNVIIAEKKLVKCTYDLLYFIFCTRSSTKSAT